MSVYINKISDSLAIDPIQAAIDIAAIDHTLFESLITEDIRQVFGESSIIYLTEEEKKKSDEKQKEGIIESIKAVIKKAIEAVKGFFKKIGEFFSNIGNKLKNNDIQKYKDVKYSDLKDCPYKGVTYVKADEFKDVLEKIVKYGRIFYKIEKREDGIQYYDYLNNHGGETECDKEVDEIRAEIKEDIESDTKIFVSKQDDIETVKLMKEVDWNKMRDNTISGFKELERQSKAFDATIKFFEKEASESEKNAGDDAESAKKYYNTLTRVIGYQNKSIEIFGSLVKKYTSIATSAVIKFGKWGLNHKSSSTESNNTKEESTATAEAYNDYVDTYVDILVENAWEM